MAQFDLSIDAILAHEGGFVNNLNDPGGATNFGIIKSEYDKFKGYETSIEEIKNMPLEDAKTIYRKNYWKFDGVNSQEIATKIFDMCVNLGVKNGVLVVQKACQLLGANIVIDGGYGKNTEAAINSILPDELIDAICLKHAERYQNILTKDINDKALDRGWTMDQITRAITYVNSQDIPNLKALRKELKASGKILGKFDFAAGWLLRAQDKCGL